MNGARTAHGNTQLPFKSGFAETDLAYLDSGSQHPISLGALASLEGYLARRTSTAQESIKNV